MKFTPEHLEKAKQAKSAEELIALAKENGIESGGFRLIIITDFFILALRFLKSEKNLKNAVAFLRNASYKDMQGQNFAEAVTSFTLLRIKK